MWNLSLSREHWCYSHGISTSTGPAWDRTGSPAGFVLQAFVLLVGPFELDGVAADLFEMPGAKVADLGVVRVIVPTRAGDRIGDSFAQFVGAGSRESFECEHPSETACAKRIRHHRVIGFTNMVMVAAVVLA